jgi:murein DD-endopeptidase MepM/ murein hydrolase activator NlpD
MGFLLVIYFVAWTTPLLAEDIRHEVAVRLVRAPENQVGFDEQLNLANEIFSRVGLRFRLINPTSQPTLNSALTVVEDAKNSDSLSKFVTEARTSPRTITVFLVNAVKNTPRDRGFSKFLRFTDGTPYAYVVLAPEAGRSPDTLAHELGHVLLGHLNLEDEIPDGIAGEDTVTLRSEHQANNANIMGPVLDFKRGLRRQVSKWMKDVHDGSGQISRLQAKAFGTNPLRVALRNIAGRPVFYFARSNGRRITGIVPGGHLIRVTGVGSAAGLIASIDTITAKLYQNPRGSGAGDTFEGWLPVPMPATGQRKHRLQVRELTLSGHQILYSQDIIAAGPTRSRELGTRGLLPIRLTPSERRRLTALLAAPTDRNHLAASPSLPVEGCQSSPYGALDLWLGRPTGDTHEGIDFEVPTGTKVRSIAPGRPTGTLTNLPYHGTAAAISHGRGLVSLYTHLASAERALNRDVTVNQGQIIGDSGASGFTTGVPLLHVALHLYGVAVDPQEFGLRPAACP